MNYIIASFSSRNETLSFARLLNRNGINSGIINTPSQISGKSCSISVKFQSNALALAQKLVNQSYFQSFHGFYIVYYQNGRMFVDNI